MAEIEVLTGCRMWVVLHARPSVQRVPLSARGALPDPAIALGACPRHGGLRRVAMRAGFARRRGAGQTQRAAPRDNTGKRGVGIGSTRKRHCCNSPDDSDTGDCDMRLTLARIFLKLMRGGALRALPFSFSSWRFRATGAFRASSFVSQSSPPD